MRRQFVFPRALVIIPIGVTLVLTLNVARIAGLVLIGAAGYPDVAILGFHSVAGWIAFNSAAVVIALVSRRSRWLNPDLAATPDAGAEATGENPTAAYLLPLLAILATGLLTRAISSGFETLYGLRLAVAALALFYYRDTLSRLDWRCSWRGIAAGLAVAALWFPAAAWLLPHADMPPALRAFSDDGRALWIALRTLGSVIVVPIAEELAYRGYLMRRLASEEFDALPFARAGLRALLISALIFGLGHGALWLPGIAAGLIYGAVVIRTGRLGEGVVAHATTNALLSIAVLTAGQWQLW
jgi:exosortase E/protease (VPEID-CTERM system)